MLKILHVFFAKSEISIGIINQLDDEYRAAQSLGECQWDIKYWLPGSYSKSYIQAFSNDILSVFIHNIKFYIWLNKVSDDYDYILIRYPTYDPFAFLLNLKCRHLSVHHTKESLESLHNRFPVVKKLIEKYITRRLISTASGVVGVTLEIALSAKLKNRNNIPYYVLPNGINLQKINICKAEHDIGKKSVKLLFVASSLTPWHGLDRIVKAIGEDSRFKLYVIGNIEPTHELQDKQVYYLGKKDKQEICEIARQCDLALGGFGFDRINLSEATPLKVREYLAMGIPVYSGIKDYSIPVDFPFYRFTPNTFDCNFLYQFYLDIEDSTPQTIRLESEPYISKTYMMKKFVNSLEC